jgi:hypothetical protein
MVDIDGIYPLVIYYGYGDFLFRSYVKCPRRVCTESLYP